MVNYVYNTLPETHQKALEKGYAKASSDFVSESASQDPELFKHMISTATRNMELGAAYISNTTSKADTIYTELSAQLGIPAKIATSTLQTMLENQEHSTQPGK